MSFRGGRGAATGANRGGNFGGRGGEFFFAQAILAASTRVALHSNKPIFFSHRSGRLSAVVWTARASPR